MSVKMQKSSNITLGMSTETQRRKDAKTQRGATLRPKALSFLCAFASLRLCVSVLMLRVPVSILMPSVSVLILMLSIIVPSLWAASPRQAQLFFEAGDYPQASDQYQQLLQTDLSDWQKATVNYNLGTILLKEEKWNEAIHEFEIASETPNLSPLLQQRLAVNTALAMLMISKEESTAKRIKSTFDAISFASVTNCHLEFAEGAKTCTPAAEITSLFDAVNQLKAAFVEHHPLQSLDLPTAYMVALTEEPLTEATLANLEQMHQKLHDDRGLTYLQKAKKLKISSDSIEARMLLEMALNAIDKPEGKQRDIESILNDVIDKEALALQLNRLEQQRADKDRPLTFSSEIQKETSQIADQFLQQALVQQKSDFNNDAGKLSFSPPWEEIIPLFSSGQQAATQAQKMLDSQDYLGAASFQIEALRKWKEALAKLHAKKTNPEQKKEEQSFNTLLKTLQEMEDDDKSKPILISPSTSLGKEKPW